VVFEETSFPFFEDPSPPTSATFDFLDGIPNTVPVPFELSPFFIAGTTSNSGLRPVASTPDLIGHTGDPRTPCPAHWACHFSRPSCWTFSAFFDVQHHRRTTRLLSHRLYITFCCWEEHPCRCSTRLLSYRLYINARRWDAHPCRPSTDRWYFFNWPIHAPWASFTLPWSLPRQGLLSMADQHRVANFTATQSLHPGFWDLASTLGPCWCSTCFPHSPTTWHDHSWQARTVVPGSV
jgi:hypothetical protein